MRKSPQTYTLSNETVEMLKKYATKQEWSLSLSVEKILNKFLSVDMDDKKPVLTFEEKQAIWEKNHEEKRKSKE